MNTKTILIQGGYSPKNGEPLKVPIAQSTSYKYETSEQMANLFALKESGYFYSRLANPTCDSVAAKIAQLEGGVASVLTASGQTATFFACFNIAEAGSHIICMADVYGGTHNLLEHTFRKMGVETTFVPTNDLGALEDAFRKNTKLVFGETLANPTLNVLDIEAVADIAHEHGVPLIVDNTFATPINCRPFKWGADIIVHSTTKYMEGHGVATGGVIIDSGKFDWSKYPRRYACLVDKDPSYHGLSYTESFGEGAYITKIVAQLMRDFGACQKPQDAFYLGLGLQTLDLRMKQHNDSAEEISLFLSELPEVSWVKYPKHSFDEANHHLANKYLNGCSGVISFALNGTKEQVSTFLSSLKVVAIATHVADSHSMVLHPALHTHSQLTDEELELAGVPKDLIRLSIGLEDAEDIKADIIQALRIAFPQKSNSDDVQL